MNDRNHRRRPEGGGQSIGESTLEGLSGVKDNKRKRIEFTDPPYVDSESSSVTDIAAGDAEASIDSDSSSDDSCGMTTEELRHRSNMLLYIRPKMVVARGCIYPPPVLGEVSVVTRFSDVVHVCPFTVQS